MLVPDTLEGAILLSLIDFFLSFGIIIVIGFILAAFPALNRLVARTKKRPDRRLIQSGDRNDPCLTLAIGSTMTADTFLSVKTLWVLLPSCSAPRRGVCENDVGSPVFVIWPVAPTG